MAPAELQPGPPTPAAVPVILRAALQLMAPLIPCASHDVASTSSLRLGKPLPGYERQFAIPIVGPGICAGVVGTYVKTVFPDFDLDMIVSDTRHERAG